MSKSEYIKGLEKDITQKQKELEVLYEKRIKEVHKENFYNIQQQINIVTVDIATKKSRIENYGKTGVCLPDRENAERISNHINK